MKEAEMIAESIFTISDLIPGQEGMSYSNTLSSDTGESIFLHLAKCFAEVGASR